MGGDRIGDGWHALTVVVAGEGGGMYHTQRLDEHSQLQMRTVSTSKALVLEKLSISERNLSVRNMNDLNVSN